MRLNTVPARQGLQWASKGMRTFAKQPLALSGLFFLFMALVSLVSMVPMIGMALGLVAMPALTTGLMVATQIAEQGRPPMPSTLWVALRSGPQRKPMLQLGVLYAVGFLLIMATSTLVDDGQLARIYLAGDPIGSELAQSAHFQLALWATLLLYGVLTMLFWHAPALVFWQGVPAVKSLFFSAVACWRNKGAFVVYVCVWSAAFGAAALVALFVAMLLGQPPMVLSIMVPLILLVMVMFFTSMLFTVRDCFDLTEG